MSRSYLSGGMRSLGYGRRIVRGPQRDWRGQSDFKRRSLPEKPHFIRVAGKGWEDWRSPFSPVCFRRLLRRRGFFDRPGYAALKERVEWVKQYGLRRKLQNAASMTLIRRKVANRRAHQGHKAGTE